MDRLWADMARRHADFARRDAQRVEREAMARRRQTAIKFVGFGVVLTGIALPQLSSLAAAGRAPRNRASEAPDSRALVRQLAGLADCANTTNERCPVAKRPSALAACLG